MKVLQKMIVPMTGIFQDSRPFSVAGNATGQFVVAYHIEDGSYGGELGWTLFDTSNLKALRTDKLVQPYYQGNARTIDTGNTTFIAYDSTPRGYHAIQNGIFIRLVGVDLI